MREILGDLINLTDVKIKNQYLRALAFQLFEKNGVIKRDEINNIIKKIPEAERKLLWGMGIKIGRYHVYLPKMLKPKAVTFRVSLWNLFNNFQTNFDIPKFGLNFLEKSRINQELLLLCGFEKFREFFVRIDILEKLFLKIIEKTKENKFQVDSSMMNLLGCSKENFYKLMIFMNYKKDKDLDTYKYIGLRKNKLKKDKLNNKDNPFNKLLELKLGH